MTDAVAKALLDRYQATGDPEMPPGDERVPGYVLLHALSPTGQLGACYVSAHLGVAGMEAFTCKVHRDVEQPLRGTETGEVRVRTTHMRFVGDSQSFDVLGWPAEVAALFAAERKLLQQEGDRGASTQFIELMGPPC